MRYAIEAFIGAFVGLGVAVGLACGVAAPAGAQGAPAVPVEPKALAVLKAACEALTSAKTMQFTALDTYERKAVNGQPLYYSTLSEVAMRRPDRLRVIKRGDGTPDEFYYDGKAMMAFVPEAGLAAVAEAPPTIDAMLDAAWKLGAVYFPFSDVLVSQPCAVFDQKMKSAFYVGRSVVVGGTTTDMIAVAGEDVQAELWIGTEDHLPRQVRVTYPNEPGHGHYQTDYSNWRIDAPIEDEAFASAKAASGVRIPFTAPTPGQEKVQK